MLGHAAEARGYPHPLRPVGRLSRRVEAWVWPGRAALVQEALDLTSSILGRLDMRTWSPRAGEEGACLADHAKLAECVSLLADGRSGLVRLRPELRLGETVARIMNPPLEPLRPDVLQLGAAMLAGSVPLSQLSAFGNSALAVSAVRGVSLSRLDGVMFSRRDDQLVRETAEAIASAGEEPTCALTLARELARDSAAVREIALVLLGDGMPVGESVTAARALAA